MGATGLALGATAIVSLRGQYNVPLANGLLNQPGERSGVILTLLLLLVPVLGFLGQCARIGALHRDRRLAGLRLAGATPGQVRRIAALEAGLTCLLGSVVATVFAALLLLSQWQHPPATVWAGFALVMVAVPLLGVLVSTLALRRVIASPLGWVRRVRPQPGKGRGPGLAFIAAALVLLTVGLVITPGTFGGFGTAPLLIFTVVVVTGMGAVWLTGATARLTGRLLAARTGNPATLIAAERLRDDPWAAARTHAAVLLVTVVGTAFVGIRQTLLAGLTGRDRRMFADNMSFYTTGINLTGAAILVALGITLAGLAVGTAESLAARRRGLSAQAAAGVPRPVLAKALLLETALPLAPAVALAGLGGIGIGVLYAAAFGEGIPVLPLLVPPAVYAACLLAAAASLPRLRRSVHPAELRYA
ncbi:hypothetical protein SAV14893_049270 [Streptomyces avermitilis]|nr:hypothetical protein SAVMC3_61580 [Streptomyces avermitilis]GDY65534.1 hypothetical protein SAV14893_049270 [Streptomyces avermitilis]GDY74253.1 hypothetical protein SAV31267_037380 [Streptomyces avermitilis]GDY83313.1 hypothetical protein SAVCW2_25120 [Streptomyces avermitilis]